MSETMNKSVSELKLRLQALCQALSEERMEDVEQHLDWLTVLREAQVARELQKLSQVFEMDLDNMVEATGEVAGRHVEMKEASEKLQYVVDETEKAATQTLDIAESLDAELRVLKEELNDAAQQARIEAMLQQLQTLIMAQGYQDLTGQVIRRMIPMMKEMHEIMDKLVRAAGHDLNRLKNQSPEADLMKGAGPSVTSREKQDTAQSQEDVDDLLSALGI